MLNIDKENIKKNNNSRDFWLRQNGIMRDFIRSGIKATIESNIINGKTALYAGPSGIIKELEQEAAAYEEVAKELGYFVGSREYYKDKINVCINIDKETQNELEDKNANEFFKKTNNPNGSVEKNNIKNKIIENIENSMNLNLILSFYSKDQLDNSIDAVKVILRDIECEIGDIRIHIDEKRFLPPVNGKVPNFVWCKLNIKAPIIGGKLFLLDENMQEYIDSFLNSFEDEKEIKENNERMLRDLEFAKKVGSLSIHLMTHSEVPTNYYKGHILEYKRIAQENGYEIGDFYWKKGKSIHASVK